MICRFYVITSLIKLFFKSHDAFLYKIKRVNQTKFHLILQFGEERERGKKIVNPIECESFRRLVTRVIVEQRVVELELYIGADWQSFFIERHAAAFHNECVSVVPRQSTHSRLTNTAIYITGDAMRCVQEV